MSNLTGLSIEPDHDDGVLYRFGEHVRVMRSIRLGHRIHLSHQGRGWITPDAADQIAIDIQRATAWIRHQEQKA